MGTLDQKIKTTIWISSTSEATTEDNLNTSSLPKALFHVSRGYKYSLIKWTRTYRDMIWGLFFPWQQFYPDKIRGLSHFFGAFATFFVAWPSWTCLALDPNCMVLIDSETLLSAGLMLTNRQAWEWDKDNRVTMITAQPMLNAVTIVIS